MIPSDPTLNFDPYTKCLSENKQVEITFADGTVQKFSAALLDQFPFFKTCFASDFQTGIFKKVTLGAAVKADLDILIELFYNNRHIYDVVHPDSLEQPEFYECLEFAIRFFLADEADAALATVKEELRVFPYPLALSLLKNCREYIGGEQKPPFCFSVIEDLVAGVVFFKTVENYEECYLSVLREKQAAIAKKWRSIRITHDMGAAVDLQENNCLRKFFNGVIYTDEEKEGIAEIHNICLTNVLRKKSEIVKTQFEIRHIRDHFNPDKVKPSALYKLAHPSDGEEKRELKLAKRYWKIYKAKVLDSLQYQYQIGARMHKTALLCPKLFAHYNLVPHLDKTYSYSEKMSYFTCGQNQMTWYMLSFGQESLLELEAEMIQDFNAFDIEPPEVLFSADRELWVPKQLPPISDEISALKNSLDFLVTEKKHLLELWEWDKFGITPHDIEFKVLPSGMADEDKVRIAGILDKFGKKWRFFFSLHDFQPIILDFAIDPTPEATEAHLETLYKESKMRWNSPFNFFL